MDYNANTKAIPPQASYRDITAMAWRNINGIKRYWYVPIIVSLVIAAVIDSSRVIDTNISVLPSRSIDLGNILSIVTLAITLLILLGQQRIALQQWRGEPTTFADFFRFDSILGRFFLLQLFFVAIEYLLSFFNLDAFLFNNLSIRFLLITGFISTIVALWLETLCHYLGYGVIEGHWSPVEAFTKGISSLLRQGTRIGLLLGHITLWSLVFTLAGFALAALGIMAQSYLAIITISVIGMILVIRLYVFFELVIAGIYLQDAARATPEKIDELTE